jgi:hypothetical protein
MPLLAEIISRQVIGQLVNNESDAIWTQAALEYFMAPARHLP